MIHRLLLSTLCMFLAACSGGDEPGRAAAGGSPPAKVRLQLNWFPEPEFGGLYAAQERGIFAQRGLEVELLQGGADVPAPQLVAAGRVELAVVAAEQLLTLRAAGGKVRALFAAFQRAPRVILVREEAKYQSLPELWASDATVMASDGLAFVKWLNAQYGGRRLQFVPYGGSAAPLLAGSVDAMQAFATAEPVQLGLDGFRVRYFVVAETGYNPYEVVVAANEEWLAANPALAQAVVAALREGWRSYLDDPGPVNEVMARLNRDMSRAVMDKSAGVLRDYVESADTRANGLGWMSTERWDALAGQLVSLGMLTDATSARGCFANIAPTN